MRMTNEMIYVKGNGGHTVNVQRHGFVDLTRDPNHPSETELDNYAYDITVMVADGELDQLKKDAIFVFEHILSLYTPDGDKEMSEVNSLLEVAC
jgi:hypothetical protein